MSRTSYISMRRWRSSLCTRTTPFVGFLQCQLTKTSFSR